MKKLTSILCLFLSFVLVFSMLPITAVMAEETEVTETTELTQASPEEIEEQAIQLLENEPELFTTVTRAAAQTGEYTRSAVIIPRNRETVPYVYQGVQYEKKEMLMHRVWYESEYQIAYCIEPGASVIQDSIYDASEMGASDTWGELDFAKQRGVALTLLYGAPNSLDSSDVLTSLAYQIATYVIIHEIIIGWRQDVHPFAQLNDAYYKIYGGGTAEKPVPLVIANTSWYPDLYWSYLRREDLQYAYHYISDKLAKHDLIPSFASSFRNQAPTHYLQDNGNGTYSVTLTDTRGILPEFRFTNTADLTFSKSADGKSVTITTTNPNLEEVLVEPSKSVPSPNNSAYLIWDAETGSQRLCSLKAAKDDPVPAFFKLAISKGDLTITKVTDDEQHRGGWQFYIYGDENCSQLISGPHVTDANGKVTVSGLNPGKVWIEEGGNIDAVIHSYYETNGPGATEATIWSGQTSEITVVNRMMPASISVMKVNTESKPLANATLLLEWSEDGITWQPVSYTDSRLVVPGGCTAEELVDGKLTTDDTGVLQFTGLHPALQYRMTEVEAADGYQLLTECVYEGGIPPETLNVSLQVVNAPVFTLPHTGDAGLATVLIYYTVCLTIAAGVLMYCRKKQTDDHSRR